MSNKAQTTQTPIKLLDPFTTAAGVPIEQVHVKGVKVRDMKNAQRMAGDDQASYETALIGIACDLLPEDLDNMSMRDYGQLQARFQQANGQPNHQTTDASTGTAG